MQLIAVRRIKTRTAGLLSVKTMKNGTRRCLFVDCPAPSVLPAAVALHQAFHLIAQSVEFIAQLTAFLGSHDTVPLEAGLVACNGTLTHLQSACFAPRNVSATHALVNALADVGADVVDAGC